MKKWLVLILCTLGVLAYAQDAERVRTVHSPTETSAEQLAARYPGVFVIEARSRAPRVALTFDDGPGEATPAVLEVLRRHKVHATFFLVGRSIDAYPKIAQQVVAEGHEVGNHSWNHPSLARLPGDQAMSEQIAPTTAVIGRVLQLKPTLMRPPYGEIRADQVEQLHAAGLKTIFWSIDTKDWSFYGKPGAVDNIVAPVLEHAHPGAIILMHDGLGHGEQVAAALEQIIVALRARGLEPVTVSELLATGK